MTPYECISKRRASEITARSVSREHFVAPCRTGARTLTQHWLALSPGG